MQIQRKFLKNILNKYDINKKNKLKKFLRAYFYDYF